jgi:hypothetical protein
MMFFRLIPPIYMVFLLCGVVTAQQTIDSVIDTTLTVKRDVRLDSLVMRHIRVNELKDGFDGYRLQLYSGSGTTARQEANTLRAEFLSKYPDIPAYVVYQAPNFKVRVGDYRTELEAIHLQRELAYKFPGGFVVKDLVKFPKLAMEVERNEEDGLEEDASPLKGEFEE